MTFSVSSLFRLARVGFVLAREGAFAIADPADLPPPAATLPLPMAKPPAECHLQSSPPTTSTVAGAAA